jgi:hypothetical protein
MECDFFEQCLEESHLIYSEERKTIQLVGFPKTEEEED